MSEREPLYTGAGAEIIIQNIPHVVDRWDLIKAVANCLHKPPFRQPRPDRKLNFILYLFQNERGGVHNGSGVLKVPSGKIARQFLEQVKRQPIKLGGSKIRFRDRNRWTSNRETATLQKAPFVDPDLEKDRQWRKEELEQGPGLRVVKVQFGILFQDPRAQPGASRKYSIEWEKEYSEAGQAWLKFVFDHKLIKIEAGNRLSENVGTNIVINFASISKIAVGYDYGNAFIIFDTTTPPIFEEADFYRPSTGNARDDKHMLRTKSRIGSVERHETHARVAPFAYTVRLLLPNNTIRGVDVIEQFRQSCSTALLQTRIVLAKIEAAGWKFFSETNLRAWRLYTTSWDWPVAFQLESLLHSGLLHTKQLLDMKPRLKDLHKKHGSRYLGEVLRKYSEQLSDPNRPAGESHIKCFERVVAKFIFKEKQPSMRAFSCYHVIITPTRMILEGPYATDSNRVIRQYEGYEDYFIRVAFSDEDRLRLRWDRDYSNDHSNLVHRMDDTFEESEDLDFEEDTYRDRPFLEERVNNILKGFELAGRHFEFLAYSNSALKEHSLWFMNPFQHHDPQVGYVTAQTIRDSIGDFATREDEEINEEKPPLLWLPSKYAARLAQAFTATERSVKIRPDEWEIMEDLGRDPYLFTDGVGTISEELGDKIWDALCADRSSGGERAVKPSAYQIRFLGFKGVVVVDKEIDKTPGKIHMRLRPSMHKFENSHAEEADIEIAEAFETPMMAYFNKSLVMILEDRGVKRDTFLTLLENAKADAQLVDLSISDCHNFLSSHSFGGAFHLPWILEQLAKRNAEIISPMSKLSKKINIDTAFLKGLRNVSRMQVLKEMKHDARIPIPDSHLLVGVADEGPAYVDDKSRSDFDSDNTYCLGENKIFACIQRPDDPEPKYIQGACLIWRSPLVHPGDVQRVHAIGKPPPHLKCLFGHLKNVVVLPSQGRRSLASCLGGGDLDGDTYVVSTYGEILPPRSSEPANYAPGKDKNIGRDCKIEDVHNFIVEYFNADVLGLLSDRLLVIADQSEKGFFDPECEKLAGMCSQAVDYPKKGIPVNIKKLPKPLIRAKPDWHAAEVINPRKSDYYESTRVLGYMYRAIKADDISLPDDWTMSKKLEPLAFPTDSISLLLSDSVFKYLSPFDHSRKDPDIDVLFQNYVDNLRYISAIHTLSNDASVRLTEQEVVLGIILANCSERRWKRERMYKMRTHTSTLVKETKQGFQPLDRAGEIIEDREGLLYILDKVWYAWISRQDDIFGTNSFRLIALGSVLDCLGKLEAMSK
ncbi:hypothetical protein GYMLUDRAFT_215812 [Collybiopsis luxurians FD-317 M1]|nr:hypothetical protein GYMLUDRAFT_215812 [Collybiopsis luxurians FD-317 M1]